MVDKKMDDTEIAKGIILDILQNNKLFSRGGVLTAWLGEEFKKKHPDGKTFKELSPNDNITKFIGKYLSDEVILKNDPNNPIKIYALSKSALQDVDISVTGAGSSLRFPKKLYKFRSFLLSLSVDEREKLKVDGNLILSLLKEDQ